MRFKLTPRLIAAVFVIASSLPVHSQAVPAARQGGLPIVVGAALSNYSIDWGPGQRMFGISAWADWLPNGLPGHLHGLGIEATGRAIDFDRKVPRMRQDTILGGPMYAWNPYHGFRPYVRFGIGIGSIDFPPPAQFPYYSHDTFLVSAPGGGAEYHLWQHLWVRGDYEYQFWHQTFGPNDLTPQGFTIGASYDFRQLPPQ